MFTEARIANFWCCLALPERNMLGFMWDSAVPLDQVVLKTTFDAAAAVYGLEPPLLRKEDFLTRYLFTPVEVEIPPFPAQDAYKWDTIFYIELAAFFQNTGRGCPTLCSYLTYSS